MQRFASLKETVSTWRGLEKKAREIADLISLSIEEENDSLEGTIVFELNKLERELDELEFEAVLSGPYDGRAAILGIHAGAGGRESQDWAEMLLRMYLRWTERVGYRAEMLHDSPGEEGGIKSALVEVSGKWAYGYLKAERGVHRLVRISPFDASHSRHTSFALVEVLPESEGDIEVSIAPEDVRIDVFRAGGHGGQNVQKNATAVRITHQPTGIVVVCQNERSQLQNREMAMKVLRARLFDMEMKKRAEEQARLKGEHVSAEWGNQIRSYVLHPYRMVKDHRTGYETSDTTAILNGEIEPLLAAYLLSTVGRSARS